MLSASMPKPPVRRRRAALSTGRGLAPAFLVLLLLLPLSACNSGTGQHNADTKAGRHQTTAKTADARPKVPAGAVAVVNGQPVSDAMLHLYGAARSQQQAPGTQPDRKAVLNELINLVLLAQAAHKDGLADTPKVSNRLEFQRTNILAGAMIEKILRGLKISDREIAAAYQRDYKNQVRHEYKTRNIMLHTKAEAEQVIADLARGGDFARLAREKSIGPAASHGGALQWFKPRDVLNAFASAVEKLHKGQYTTTPVHTRYGWNVILLEDVRELPTPALKDVKDKIRIELARKRLDAYLQKLRTRADIVDR